jgi:hypothetical protein
MTHPRKPRPKRREPVIDPVLDEKAEALLHMPPALMSQIWQDAAGCADPDCATCRLGRALAWVSKASVDIDIAMTVAEAVLDTLPEGEKDEAQREKLNLDLAKVAIRQLTEATENVTYWGVTLGVALAARPVLPGTMTVDVVGEDDTSMTVTLKRVRPDGNGRAN